MGATSVELPPTAVQMVSYIRTHRMILVAHCCVEAFSLSGTHVFLPDFHVINDLEFDYNISSWW